MRAPQRSRTALVEITVVAAVALIVLAALVIPHYSRATREARIGALHGIAGTIRSSVVLVQARHMTSHTSPVVMPDGTVVAVFTSGALRGMPLSAPGGIDRLLDLDGSLLYSPGATAAVWQFRAAPGDCSVTYDIAAGGAVSLKTGGC
jgi:hypothetical protein